MAKALGVSDKTVAAVRDEGETTSEIPKLSKTVGADGKERRKPIRTAYRDPTPEGEKEALDSAKAIRLDELFGLGFARAYLSAKQLCPLHWLALFLIIFRADQVWPLKSGNRASVQSPSPKKPGSFPAGFT